MLVGLVAPAWLPVPPPAYGGTESVIDRLARGLVAAGHEVLLAASSDSRCPVPRVAGLPTAEPERMGVTVVEVPYTLRAYDALGEVDVLHDHTSTGPLCARRRMPIVATNHGPFDSDLRPIYAEMSRRGVAVVAISAHQASTALGVNIARVIHHGIDLAAVPVGAGDGGYACFLGRMCAAKGVREAILVARRSGLPLKIAAKAREPGERAYFEKRVRPLLGGDVEYLGEVAGADKYALLGGAVALINPLQWAEPFGLAMIEALACGTPVVATPCGSVPEIVEEGVTGFVRSGSGALASALMAALTLNRSTCRDAVVSRFSTEHMVDEHLRLYRSLLDEASVRTPLLAAPPTRLLPPPANTAPLVLASGSSDPGSAL